MSAKFPILERGCRIEIPAPRNGRPGYRWVEGWTVRYSETRVSLPMRRNEALEELARAKRETATN